MTVSAGTTSETFEMGCRTGAKVGFTILHVRTDVNTIQAVVVHHTV
jgi:hypothetical protein